MTVWPAAVTVVGDACLTKPIDGAGVSGNVTGDGGDVIGLPFGSTPVAVPLLEIVPRSTSAWVTTYVAVHVACCFGANVTGAHDGVGAGPDPVKLLSWNTTFVNVTFPLFVATNVYVTVSPNVGCDGGVADFTTLNDPFDATVTTALDGELVTAGPDGGVPATVAVFVIFPASISACVTVYFAAHVVVPWGASVDAWQVTADSIPVPENDVSLTVGLVSVTLPVFVTVNV